MKSLLLFAQKFSPLTRHTVLLGMLAFSMSSVGWGQTLHDSFSDGDFTASPAWGGNTSAWTVVANSDAAAGATGSNTLRLASTGTTTVYLSSQISTWGTNQEWGGWIGRRAQAFTAANQAYFWLFANESNLTSATVDGYRLAIGDDTGNDEIRLEYVVNGAVSATVITSSGSLTNGLTDIGFLVRVTRSSSGVWALFTSTLPTANGSGAIATNIPNSSNSSVSQGTGTNNSLAPAANNHIGVAVLHSSGTNGIASTEFDQIYFTPPASTPTITGAATATAFTTTYGTTSAVQTFAISGSSLTADLVATAPTGFEVSPDGTTYASTATFPQTSGSASGSLRIRLAATAPVTGTYNSQNIVLSSTGATSVNIATAASGNAVTAKTLTITGLTPQNKDWDGTTTASVTGTPAYDGLVNSETFSVTGSVTWAFADANVGTAKPLVRTGSYAVPSANYSVTQPSLSADIIAMVPSAPAITGITPGNEQLTVAFTPPSSNGGLSITNYEYSTNDGSTWTTPAPAVTTSPLLITGLTNGITYDVKLRAVNAVGSGAASATVGGTPAALASINVTPVIFPSALSTTYGTPSSALSFSASGSLLSGNLTITAPSGLEVSLAAESGYAASLVLTETSGTVSPTTIYARLKANAPATTYNNISISVSGGGASSQSISTSASGNTVTPKALTISGLSAESKIYDATTTVTINGTAAYAGLANDEVHNVTDSVTWTFPNPNIGIAKVLTRSADYTAPNANYTLSAQPTLSADISAKELTGTFTADNKAYDATTAATILTRNVVGKIGSEDVNHAGGSATFADADVADGKIVTLTGATLTGTAAGNYTLGSVTSTTANIIQATTVINFPSLPSGKKVGDAPFSAGITTNFGTLSYTSSNTAVATIDASTGIISLVAPGVTTITATVAGTTNYTGDSESRTLQVGAAVSSSYVVDFEGASETKTSYASASVTLSGISWNLTDVLIGTAADDYKVGSRSARLRGYGTSAMTMLADKSGGIGTISFNHRRYGTDTQIEWIVEYSMNAGTTWIEAGRFTPGSTANTFSSTINTVGSGRIRIRSSVTGSSDRRANVDNISLSAPPGNLITPTGTFSALSTTYGTESAASATTAVVTGGSLTANIVATAPAGFQVSADGSTWDATATFAQTGGFADGILHLRLAATAPAGAYNGQVVTLSSSGATNRTIAIASSNVLQKTLTLSAAAVTSKVYDATTAATITGTLLGVVGGDAVTLVGTGTFDSAGIGSTIPVTSTATLGGAAAGNYQLTQPVGLVGEITPKELTITGAQAVQRIVDATTTVAISGGTLVGVESGDTVILGGSPIGTMADATIGTAKPVTVTGFSISGASSTNYSLTQPTGLTVDILESTPFNLWAVANNATGGKPGDPDSDTYNNLMEYAFGTNPTTSSSGPIAFSEGNVTTPGQPVLQVESGVYYAVFGRRVDHVTAGVTYTVQFSAGLNQWITSATLPTVIATDGTIDAVRIRFPNFVITPSGPKKPTFFRVQIAD
jgi:hypothetical protein